MFADYLTWERDKKSAVKCLNAMLGEMVIFDDMFAWEKASDYDIVTAINALEREIEREAKGSARLEEL